MASLRTSPPPPEATLVTRWTLSSPVELRAFRAALHEAVTGNHLVAGERLDEVPELVVLVATELATNALRHGLPPTIVSLLANDDCFVLDVADHDLARAPELPDAQPFESGGRGLQLARALSLDVGWYATEDAKHIWASFDR
ncbi:ATP-binding protein [Micromonospora sp. WMMD882]|uniref:ATP-binding protein n=1 Tax=Micromonospora sp. WMMD882 TaxID=3015151 RepID=UPI00248C38B9|nr:ATP-binding protein [Micromonospora sp. WMMD882]WBB80679.1 ATP-binding protein [Micromonospora sp. WMMD882]